MSFSTFGADGNDGRPLEELFPSEDFLHAITSASKEVLDFLNRKETIDWIFSVVFGNDSTNYSLIEILIQLLTAEVEGIKQGFLTNPEIVQHLELFMKQEESTVNTARLAGAFGRIAESQLRIGKKIPHLFEFLSTHLTNISYEETLTRLAKNHPDDVDLSPDFFSRILAAPESPFFTLKFVEECSKFPETSRHLNSPLIFERLLEIAAGPEYPNLIQFYAVSAMKNLRDMSYPTTDVIERFRSSFSKIIDPRDMRLIPLLSLYPNLLDSFVEPFMHGLMPTHVNECFVRMVEGMSDEEFSLFVKRGDLPRQVMAYYGGRRVNGHLLSLAVVLHRRQRCCVELQLPNWDQFFESTCKPSPTYLAFLRIPDELTEEMMSSSGEASESEPDESSVPCDQDPPRFDANAFRRAGSWDGPRSHLLPNVQFTYVAPQLSSSFECSPKANASALPSMQMEAPLEAISSRRPRRRNVGSISLDDLQFCTETVTAASQRLVH